MNDSQEKIYTRIWNAHVKSVRTFCHAKLKGRYEDAEDMLQEAFGLLWKKIITNDVPPNPKAWLMRTVTNLSNEKYRSNTKKSDNCIYFLYEEAQLRYTYDVADVIADEQFYDEFFTELEEILNEEEKLLLYYGTIKKIPQAQIAEMLGINTTAAKQRIFRLRRKIKKLEQQKRKKLGFF